MTDNLHDLSTLQIRLEFPAMNRREVIKLAGAALCAGCGGGGESTPDAFEGTGTTMCGADLCVDLTHPANAVLANVDGARSFTAGDAKMIAIRTVATPPTFVVLSRICTHQGCNVGWNASAQALVCPCHGSRFAIDGSVTREPATRSLSKFTSTFDEATQTLTIKLA